MNLLKRPSERDDYQVIDKTAWSRIKAEEIKRGAELGKIKEKIIERDEMFSVATSA